MVRGVKRKRGQSLAQQALEEKCDYLRSKGIILPTLDSSIEDQEWEYFLKICLAVEKARDTVGIKPSQESAAFAAERKGDYDHLSLQYETLENACNHASYEGPVKVSELDAPKIQGVVATRDILKGELLCTSVPQIVVPNLAPVDDPTDLLFSDLSLAEMTAKLLILSKDQHVQDRLESLEFAGKDVIKDDWQRMCREIVSKYTWAIDHPSVTVDGASHRTVYGCQTKVAGHAFTIDGLAGMFNHSCVPNATMVSYGAVQFFYANCSIKQGTEICVSYGYDGLDDVETRRQKLEIHAGFACSCPLCLFELDVRNKKKFTSATKDYQDTGFTDIFQSILQDVNTSKVLSKICTMTTPSFDLVKDALQTTAQLMDDLIDVQQLTMNVNIVQVLSLYPRLLHAAENCPPSPSSLTAILRHCILLSSMFLAISLDRPQDVGIAFGDLFRPRIHALAQVLEEDAWIAACRQHGLCDDFAQASWWEAKKLEYTDCF